MPGETKGGIHIQNGDTGPPCRGPSCPVCACWLATRKIGWLVCRSPPPLFGGPFQSESAEGVAKLTFEEISKLQERKVV